MKELRCLVFTDQEVVKAVLDRRRRMKEPLPSGTVGTVTYRPGQPGGGGVETLIQVTGDEGDDRSMTLHESEVAAALVSYCMGRKIPLPVESDKMIHLINGALTLMITMNFKKPPRLVEDRSEAAEPAPAPAPGPVPRKAASRR
ncbi:hypothetical protein FBZ84_11121 [Azospirillum baldaniorum]|uniref:hypothetical protein n=1 Tax=Azospirillum baldaniorum TaxID=1064539 RepID=UPI00119F7537|nr:hypothetical protein [Azospirillum baldaniorum]TWA62248.1 hypothetical protein FBZ84_11121 [Azospirillum baldaniorum]